MLEQNMYVSICVFKSLPVCATGRSRSQHHIMEHNGRLNLPMSTGCITTAINHAITMMKHEH